MALDAFRSWNLVFYLINYTYIPILAHMWSLWDSLLVPREVTVQAEGVKSRRKISETPNKNDFNPL